MPERPPGKSGPWPERKIRPPSPEIVRRRRPKAGEPVYAELHCHTNFSFLDGASHPEDLVAEAVRLGLSGLAVTDHDGLYGAVRFSGVARDLELPTVFGAELTLGSPGWPRSAPEPAGDVTWSPGTAGQSGVPDPEGEHLVVLAQGHIGYARLARAISQAQMRGGKGAPRLSIEELAEAAMAPVHLHPDPSPGNDSWFVLTGCRKGTVPKALVDHGPAAAARALARLVDAFGRDRVLVELWDHGDPLDRPRNDALAALAARAGVDVVATNNVHYATPRERPLATALAAIRARRPLDALDGWLPAAGGAHLRSAAEQHRRFARWPGAVERTVEIATGCAFDLAMAAPHLPDFPVPPGHDEMSWLRELAWAGAARRYPPSHDKHTEAVRRIAGELDLIEELGFAGYFLLVHDLVEFCRRQNLYCQGRGSAANSAVCYALGITKADAVGLGLLFERFLSPERDGPPDIDLDIEHERREEAIQYVYRHYGRDRAAQVANVITYRPRSALREMAKAAGLSPGQADAVAKSVEGWTLREAEADAGGDLTKPKTEGGAGIPPLVLDLARQVQGFPRHLGIHSGGMVIADRPLVEYCPTEWAAMENRSILQWDKDDCAAAGLVKFDLLGLGMLTMLHLAVDLIAEHRGEEIDLATIPQEDAVYDLMCAADTVGVFQIESRAQMATLPRLRPRTFYDIVIEVALIRPGPIQGGSVHPYIRRRRGEEPVTYLHPLLEGCLAKTLGVPLFQEQLMQMAIDVANFTPGEADQLRQAMGSKRSHERMAVMRARLMDGMAANGITGAVAEEIAHKLEAFADFGFPESHSVSFAYLVYASSWMKLHYPAEFTAALLNAQPMGFYSPHTIVRDARRHGVEVLGPDLDRSRTQCTLEPGAAGELAVRIGLRYVRNLGNALLERIEEERLAGGPFQGLEDFARRTAAPTDAVEGLATAGAFGCFSGNENQRRETSESGGVFVSRIGLSRRDALWAAAALREARPDKLPGLVTGLAAPALPGMTAPEEAAADLWSMGLSPAAHPTQFTRPALDERGVVPIAALAGVAPREVVEVAGVVTHRQRPGTAQGVVFINLEDETGLLNVICSPGLWRRYRRVARTSTALLIRGVLERHQGVTNLVAHRLTPLATGAAPRSRDFR